ncbi:MAG TPA: PilN domain-containing protein [Candidatus Saccharimonadia bacterium]|nr:PilN domain-containing protein [Candidatus Saccharimonadia bacterium]
MINLLPPDQKEQIRYAKLNRIAIVYVRTSVAVAVVLGVIFAGSLYLLHQQTTAVANDVAEKQATIAALNKTFTPKAKDASDRLAAIKYVQVSQTRFSSVVADIAKVVPQGVSIDSMTLTGDDKTAVRITVTAASYAGALAFRNALITSPRIANADLETISSNTSGSYQTSVVVAFKPGQAK